LTPRSLDPSALRLSTPRPLDTSTPPLERRWSTGSSGCARTWRTRWWP
jgi:hypothetical protein